MGWKWEMVAAQNPTSRADGEEAVSCHTSSSSKERSDSHSLELEKVGEKTFILHEKRMHLPFVTSCSYDVLRKKGRSVGT